MEEHIVPVRRVNCILEALQSTEAALEAVLLSLSKVATKILCAVEQNPVEIRSRFLQPREVSAILIVRRIIVELFCDEVVEVGRCVNLTICVPFEVDAFIEHVLVNPVSHESVDRFESLVFLGVNVVAAPDLRPLLLAPELRCRCAFRSASTRLCLDLEFRNLEFRGFQVGFSGVALGFRLFERVFGILERGCLGGQFCLECGFRCSLLCKRVGAFADLNLIVCQPPLQFCDPDALSSIMGVCGIVVFLLHVGLRFCHLLPEKLLIRVFCFDLRRQIVDSLRQIRQLGITQLGITSRGAAVERGNQLLEVSEFGFQLLLGVTPVLGFGLGLQHQGRANAQVISDSLWDSHLGQGILAENVLNALFSLSQMGSLALYTRVSSSWAAGPAATKPGWCLIVIDDHVFWDRLFRRECDFLFHRRRIKASKGRRYVVFVGWTLGHLQLFHIFHLRLECVKLVLLVVAHRTLVAAVSEKVGLTDRLLVLLVVLRFIVVFSVGAVIILNGGIVSIFDRAAFCIRVTAIVVDLEAFVVNFGAAH
ncbi:hypothetical protein PG997_007493 [Apiospora hydei]|uniref:Uncharacterized protein n=1 Tax=Apiospora hydei TaxID=1337664 RepID=A0ABR1W867_9PEZI